MTHRLLTTAVTVLLFACRPGVAPDPRSEGTVAMADRLAEITYGIDHTGAIFSADRIVAYYDSIEPPPDERSRLGLRFQRAEALLLAGRSDEAIAELDAIRAGIENGVFTVRQPFEDRLVELLAVAHMRLGEQENCLLDHSAASCLLPIQGAGVHRRPDSVRRAMSLFGEILERHPDDLGARWLLNIAAMAAGAWPDGVPPEHLVPAEVFASEADLPRFTDRAPAAGVATVGLSGGVVADDLDGDGLLDLMVSSWGLEDQLRLFVATGDGTFEERTEAAGLRGLVGGLNLVHADYDDDGDLDVLVLRGAWLGRSGRIPNSLLANRGDGTFEDVTVAAGLYDEHPTQTAAWGDYDLDGHLDLFVGNETSPGEVHRCRLFHNRGDGTFEEVGRALGADVAGYVKGVVWGDVDDDGDPDLYLSRLLEPNLLLRNDRDRFVDVTATAGVAEPRHSFPTWFWDVDGDGHLDLFASGFPVDFVTADADHAIADALGLPTDAPRPRLYRNRGDATFEDLTVGSGLDHVLYTMGSSYGDLDNDGLPDAYLGTGVPDLAGLVPNRAFLNLGNGRFADVTTAGGLGHLQKGHAVAFADLDNDGDQDVFAVMGGSYSGDVYQNVLFENPGSGHRWLTLRLEGTRANRSAIGARIRVEVETAAGERSITALVGTGGSFGSQSLQAEIGLGDATAVRALEVRWPGGDREVVREVPLDRIVRLVEGSGRLETVELPVLDLGGGRTAHH